jgi:DNA-binding NarL/FixJ family response regulator
MKIYIALSNVVLSEGVNKLLEEEKDIKIAGILNFGENAHLKIKSLKPDIILVDLTSLYNFFGDLIKGHDKKFILFDTFCGEENITRAVLSKEIKGVLMGDASPLLLKKAIRAVARGEMWLNNATVKNLVSGLYALKEDKMSALSDREKEIVHLIAHGYRNKEIASKLFISEPTVKTHLNRIFRKLDIQSRHQLITFAIRSNEFLKPQNKDKELES